MHQKQKKRARPHKHTHKTPVKHAKKKATSSWPLSFLGATHSPQPPAPTTNEQSFEANNEILLSYYTEINRLQMQ